MEQLVRNHIRERCPSTLSLYADYIKERLGKEILETDHGFATYSYVNGGCYIEDIYVKPEHRKSGAAAAMADAIAAIALEAGCFKLYGSVVPSTKGSTDSLKVLLAYGFRIQSSGPNLIVFEKDI